MTTPGGVPNLPIGALTTSTLGERLQDFTAQTVKDRAAERVPSIFSSSTGGDISSDLSPFGIITNIWSAVNSLIAGSDPVDIQGPEDIPPLLTDFIESLPVVGAFVQFFEALIEVFNGEYTGDDETILLLQQLISPLWKFLSFVFGEFIAGFITNDDSFLKHVFEWLGYFWDLFGDVVESVLNPILELIKWAWLKLNDIFGASADEILRLIIDGIEWVWVNIGEAVVRALGGLVEFIAGLIDFDVLKGIIDGLVQFFSQFFSAEGFADFIKNVLGGFVKALTDADGILEDVVEFLDRIPFVGPLVSKLTGFNSSGDLALDLANLGTWASNLLTNKSSIPAGNLIGQLSSAVFATIPVSSINFTAGNLLSQGNFNVVETVEPGGGWAWDGDTTATGTGGSIKATATGSLQQIYSRQTIKVAAGDRIDISAVVKTSGFTAASGRSMVLSVIPWIGTTAQTAHVVHTRTTAATTFQAMTGSRIRIGGTAESGEIALSGSITALTVRLGVTANSGAVVWFDDVQVKKAGALAQTLVEYLTTTWEQAWNAVFGSGGTGKIWSDFQSAVSQLLTRANLGVTNAGLAQGSATAIIDDVGKAIYGDAAYAALAKPIKDAIRKLLGTLFGLDTSGIAKPVGSEIIADAVPDLDGSIITTGTVDTGRLDVPSIGAEINPTAGSGALLIRSASNPVSATSGRHFAPDGFYTNLSVASTDISCLRTNGAAATGAQSDYANAFKVTNAGWYMVEIATRINVGFGTGGFSCTPVLYKGTTLSGASVHKVGTEVVFVWLGTTAVSQRFVQNSFIVYLNADEIVRAGFDVSWAGSSSGLGGDAGSGTNGNETYFSISLLNKSFA